MNWLAENALPIWACGAVAMTMALIVYLQIRTNGALLGIIAVLAVVAVIGCCTSAYAAGVSGVRAPLKDMLLPLLLSLVTLLIFDLTSEREGAIRISQQPLLDLQESIRRAN